VLSQSLENFGFSALYHNTGPPYSLSIDVLGELDKIQQRVLSASSFASDLEFQETVQSLFQQTMDAHTRYQKPACYNAVFIMPFSFDLRVVPSTEANPLANEATVYLMPNLYTDWYKTVFPAMAESVEASFNRSVLLLNGLEAVSEISQWGNTHETRSNNAGARFNAALRSYLYRSSMALNVVPLTPLTLQFADASQSSVSSITFPWLASYTIGLADVNVCAAVATSPGDDRELLSPLSAHHHHQQPQRSNLLESATPLSTAVLLKSRSDRVIVVPSTAPYPLNCFLQTVTSSDAETAHVSTVLVMQVSSFSSTGFYLTTWEGFLGQAQTCLSQQFDMLVVNVMQNSGGYVCLGIRLLELLVEDYFDDHTLVQMHYDLPHSPLMDTYIEVVNSPDPYPNPQEVEQILNRDTQQAFPDGKAYYYPGRNVTQGGKVNWRTNFFSLNCTQAEAMPPSTWRPPRFLPADKLVIISDGTCGSTCASFTKIAQEANRATFVGIGGIWDQGMDVASLAGGFVCNPDYLFNMATWSGITFPKFLTNQHWQFGWATWYSAKQPSRQMQFTVEDAQYREAFWGFPHSSINATVTTAMVSSLYDRVIASQLHRLAQAAVPDSTSCSDEEHEANLFMMLSIATSVVAVLAISVVVYLLFSKKASNKSYSVLDASDNALQTNLINP
jgi:hypothetical protein